ncbi:hypothetical protein LTR62_001352 [Meristemomyces frigidus]|uniref:Glycosyltransferase family 25 protein n=1 Tax=Meristemomyces frigidus TaxID=1508187 RepID=A0AAN7T9D8_9PEZI|nr:hypothetical protein LTR62_001352 [Meristemomyces frigidus]
MSLSLAMHRIWLAAGAVVILLVLLFTRFRHPGGELPSLPLGRLKHAASGNRDGGGSLDNIQNATLGFQKIFVINLPRRVDHRDAVSLAAHLTGLEVEYMDGVTSLDERTLPFGAEEFGAHKGAIMVEENVATAIIAEDDIDWDIRVKSQMTGFARASRLMLQPLPGTTDQYLDPFRNGAGNLNGVHNFHVDEHVTTEPTSSPYGDVDSWDMMWLGDCGRFMPEADDEKIPAGRVVIPNDITVPEPHHIDAMIGSHQLHDQYPNHTRVVTRAKFNVCSLAYAISLPGARRMLYELGMKRIDRAADLALQSVCDGQEDRRMATCLTVHPNIIGGHHPISRKSAMSDIGNPADGDEWTTVAWTKNVRWSTRGNFEKLIYGETDYIDLFMDGQPEPDFGS